MILAKRAGFVDACPRFRMKEFSSYVIADPHRAVVLGASRAAPRHVATGQSFAARIC